MLRPQCVAWRSLPDRIEPALVSRLLFVDDHPLYRAGLATALAAARPDYRVFLAASCAEAIAVLDADARVDLCLADYRIPGENGLTFLEEVRRRWPLVARGLLCADPTPELLGRARAIGCVACLSKARDMDELVDALERLFDGDTVFDAPEAPATADAGTKWHAVLELAAQGRSNKEIGRALGITERTVKYHWARIFERLGVANRAEAVSRAHQLQLLG